MRTRLCRDKLKEKSTRDAKVCGTISGSIGYCFRDSNAIMSELSLMIVLILDERQLISFSVPATSFETLTNTVFH